MRCAMRAGYVAQLICFWTLLTGFPCTAWKLQVLAEGAISASDRVVFLGAGWVEGLQSEDYWETFLQVRLDVSGVVFRNQGWTGDTVQGTARALFGTPEDGFARLLRDVREVRPTCLLLGYGNNEAFEGEMPIDEFRHHWERLVNELEAGGARLIAVLPHPIVKARPHHPDPASYNMRLESYRRCMQESCREHNIAVIDLADSPAWRYTTDGLRLTAAGQWLLARDLAEKLGYPEPPWSLMLDAQTQRFDTVNVTVIRSDRQDTGWRWVSVDRWLPTPYPPAEAGEFLPNYGHLVIKNLPRGKYQLLIDDLIVVTADAQEWQHGVRLPLRGGWRQVEQLRQLIRRKNELYFHRYRPQNETYLFLFRKHEQGNNAVEIPQFDPLIADLEARIESARKPQPHEYRLVLLPK
ncbi:MAG: hypothetical protein KatS3mg109_1710 [Pirellulaceae bacterium]|nr:MAG: hypothetical protein KatS3mg109_1710 [Pirellulaceae bacterium]GIW96281.1 MAG: hypothetical protein KatS3mg110_4322 [Pirellulaceae bacterium]